MRAFVYRCKRVPWSDRINFHFYFVSISILDDSSLPLLQIVACFPGKIQISWKFVSLLLCRGDFAHMPTSWTMEVQIFPTSSSALWVLLHAFWTHTRICRCIFLHSACFCTFLLHFAFYVSLSSTFYIFACL